MATPPASPSAKGRPATKRNAHRFEIAGRDRVEGHLQRVALDGAGRRRPRIRGVEVSTGARLAIAAASTPGSPPRPPERLVRDRIRSLPAMPVPARCRNRAPSAPRGRSPRSAFAAVPGCARRAWRRRSGRGTSPSCALTRRRRACATPRSLGDPGAAGLQRGAGGLASDRERRSRRHQQPPRSRRRGTSQRSRRPGPAGRAAATVSAAA